MVMSRRTIEAVLADWRALEQAGASAEGDQAARLAAFRDEYACLVADREAKARELATPPAFSDRLDPSHS